MGKIWLLKYGIIIILVTEPNVTGWEKNMTDQTGNRTQAPWISQVHYQLSYLAPLCEHHNIKDSYDLIKKPNVYRFSLEQEWKLCFEYHLFYCR